ncbi:MAG: hypothetical protein ACYDEA_04650 [Candidatus Dormibacteria bacterium]
MRSLCAGRRVYQFRLRPTASGFQISAGEMSPRALREHAGQALQAFQSSPASKPHLTSTTCELVMAGKRLESIRVSPGLASKTEAVVHALREGALRTEAAW